MKKKKLMTLALAPALLIGAVGVNGLISTSQVSALKSGSSTVSVSGNVATITPSQSPFDSAWDDDDDTARIVSASDLTSHGLSAGSGTYSITINYSSAATSIQTNNRGIIYVNGASYHQEIHLTKVNNTKYQGSFTLPGNFNWIDYYFTDIDEAYKISTVVLTVPVSDTKAPVYEGQAITSNVDNPLTLQYILSQVKFVDEVDGDLSPVVVTDNYSSHKTTPGTWTISVQATDAAGNTGTGTITVYVVDRTAPVITGTSSYTSNLSAPISESTIRAGLSVSDNVNNNLSVTLVSDGYSAHKNTPGTYYITYKATDSSGNQSSIYTVTVTVVDNVKPVISVKSGYSSTFTTTYKNRITLNSIKEALQVTDNVDSNLSLELVEDRYSNSYNVPGSYTVKFRATDTAGNISDTFTVTVVVNDNEAPVFYASGLFIGISQAMTLTHDELVEIMVSMYELDRANIESYQVLTSNYDVSSVNSIGIKSVSYLLNYKNGETEEISANVKVLGDEVQEEAQQVVDENTEVEDKEETEEKEESAVARFFKNVGEFFVKLFRSFIKYICFGWAWDKDGKFEPNWKNWN